MTNQKPVIALDGDGVLLDYHLAYQQAWHKAFGDLPKVRDPLAYWPKDRFDVRQLDSAELNYFRSFFDHDFWRSIPPIENAIEACHKFIDGAAHAIVSRNDPNEQENVVLYDVSIK